MEKLEGLWTYTAYEADRVSHAPEQVAAMATIVLLPGQYLPDWHGLWALVTYGHRGGKWSAAEVKASCRQIILGAARQEESPASDFYLWAGGRFRTEPQRLPMEMDFEQFWRGDVLPRSTQLAIYNIDATRLTLCLAELGSPRPSGFETGDHHSLGELMRGEGCGQPRSCHFTP